MPHLLFTQVTRYNSWSVILLSDAKSSQYKASLWSEGTALWNLQRIYLSIPTDLPGAVLDKVGTGRILTLSYLSFLQEILYCKDRRLRLPISFQSSLLLLYS